MKQTLDAIYEQGVFRPLQNPEVAEGQHVRLVVETLPESSVEDILDSAAQVYTGLSDEQIDEIEQIALGGLNEPKLSPIPLQRPFP